MTNLIYEALFCFIAMFSFGLIFRLSFNLKFMIIASLNAVMGWSVYRILALNGQSRYLAYFLGALTCAVFGEIIARFVRAPASIFYVIGCLPLVPGGGIYLTMLYLTNNQQDLFLATFIDTIIISGAIAVAILIGGTFFRLFRRRKANENPWPYRRI